MPTMIQIRNVPEDMHRKLKARAALAGTSLSEYLVVELRKSLERPTRAELLERIAARSRTRPGESAARAVRRERERR
jgi:antitoxin FitA